MEAWKATTEAEVGWDEAFQNVDLPPSSSPILEQCILFHEASPNWLELNKDYLLCSRISLAWRGSLAHL